MSNLESYQFGDQHRVVEPDSPTTCLEQQTRKRLSAGIQIPVVTSTVDDDKLKSPNSIAENEKTSPNIFSRGRRRTEATSVTDSTDGGFEEASRSGGSSSGEAGPETPTKRSNEDNPLSGSSEEGPPKIPHGTQEGLTLDKFSELTEEKDLMGNFCESLSASTSASQSLAFHPKEVSVESLSRESVCPGESVPPVPVDVEVPAPQKHVDPNAHSPMTVEKFSALTDEESLLGAVCESVAPSTSSRTGSSSIASMTYFPNVDNLSPNVHSGAGESARSSTSGPLSILSLPADVAKRSHAQPPVATPEQEAAPVTTLTAAPSPEKEAEARQRARTLTLNEFNALTDGEDVFGDRTASLSVQDSEQSLHLASPLIPEAAALPAVAVAAPPPSAYVDRRASRRVSTATSGGTIDDEVEHPDPPYYLTLEQFNAITEEEGLLGGLATSLGQSDSTMLLDTDDSQVDLRREGASNLSRGSGRESPQTEGVDRARQHGSPLEAFGEAAAEQPTVLTVEEFNQLTGGSFLFGSLCESRSGRVSPTNAPQEHSDPSQTATSRDPKFEDEEDSVAVVPPPPSGRRGTLPPQVADEDE